MPLSTLIEELVAPHRDFGVAIKVRIAVAGASEPVGTRNPAILYGVGNILENAVDFARKTVEVNAWWNSETVEIVISDDGPGFAPDILKRIGEPYLSRRRGSEDPQSGRRGLGLGVFIARTLLERTGAKVSFRNRTFPDHGAVVQIAWPRSRFEATETKYQTNQRLRAAPQQWDGCEIELNRPWQRCVVAPYGGSVSPQRRYQHLERHRRID